MSSLAALVCPRCGGPLTSPAALPRLLDCVYCGAALAVGAAEGATLRARVTPDAVVQQRRAAFQQALVAALGEGTPPFDAVRDAARDHLDLGAEADTAARVALGLVRAFEREQRVVAATQPLVLARIVEAYLRALDALREADSAEINLPFLTADATGPKHLRRTVTAASFVQLAADDPAPPAHPAPPPPPSRRSWWWPLG